MTVQRTVTGSKKVCQLSSSRLLDKRGSGSSSRPSGGSMWLQQRIHDTVLVKGLITSHSQ